MAGFKSDSVCNALLDVQYGDGSPATLYCALSTTTPTSAGSNFTEPSGGVGYARVAVTNDSTNFPNASSKTKHNGADIIFPTATGSWGTITWAGWYDASSGGNLLSAGPLSASKTIGAGDVLKFAASTGFTATES